MGRRSVRETLLEAGVTVLHQRGFNTSGVREITQAAGVPLGCFTNHFKSKEEFGALVLDRYMAALLNVVARTLRDLSRRPHERIAAYFDSIAEIAKPFDWRFGCLLANMGLELPVHSDLLRDRIAKHLADLTEPFADTIREAQRDGEARTDVAAEDLAVIVLASWHGALLRAKIERDGGVPTMFARTLPLLLRSGATADRLLANQERT